MRKALYTLVIGMATMSCSSDEIKLTEPTLVEASCGQCNFGLEAPGCHLAVKIGEKAYFVDGTSIDEHGDAHSHDGFCEVVKNAKVTGEVIDGRFAVNTFEIVEK